MHNIHIIRLEIWFRIHSDSEISLIGLDQMIELVETFKIVPIFCEYFWIFLNKIVFEMVFRASPESMQDVPKLNEPKK